MSIRETWRWIVFSLTGRVPGQAHVAERRVVGADEAAGLGLTGLWDCPTCGPASLEPHPRLAVIRCSNCKEQVRGTKHPDTPDDTCTGPLTAALGGDRTAKVIAHTLGTHGYSLAAVHGMSDAELLAVPGIGETSLTWIREHVAGSERHTGSSPYGIPETHRGSRENCTYPDCEPEPGDTVPVPRGALRRLVKVARQVAASEPYPDPVPARDALAALDDAGLLDQFRRDSDG